MAVISADAVDVTATARTGTINVELASVIRIRLFNFWIMNCYLSLYYFTYTTFLMLKSSERCIKFKYHGFTQRGSALLMPGWPDIEYGQGVAVPALLMTKWTKNWA